MINILYSANYKYFPQVLISATSIANHASEPICVHIFTVDLHHLQDRFIPVTESQRKFLEDILKTKNKDNQVKLFNIDEEYATAHFNEKVEAVLFTPYALLRLFVDKVKNIPDKILYLDTDTISNKDIKELFDKDITNYELAAVRDVFIWGLKNHKKYFNSGMLLLNVKKIKETGLLEKCRKSINENLTLFVDQDALNYNVKDLLLLDRKFNRIHGDYKNAVVHHMCDCRHHLLFRFKSSDLALVRKYRPHYIPLIDECEAYINKAKEEGIL